MSWTAWARARDTAGVMADEEVGVTTAADLEDLVPDVRRGPGLAAVSLIFLPLGVATWITPHLVGRLRGRVVGATEDLRGLEIGARFHLDAILGAAVARGEIFAGAGAELLARGRDERDDEEARGWEEPSSHASEVSRPRRIELVGAYQRDFTPATRGRAAQRGMR